MNSPTQNPPGRTVEIEPLLADFGAIVHGVEFRDPDAPKILADAVHTWGVVFLRNQRMSDSEHIEYAQRFGQLGVYPLQAAAGAFEPLEFIVDGPDDPPKADGWHTDVTWIEEPPVMAILSMLEVPDRGGDTMWVDTAKAFDTLSPLMQEIVGRLDVYHDISEANRQIGVALGKVPPGHEALGHSRAEHPGIQDHEASYWQDWERRHPEPMKKGARC